MAESPTLRGPRISLRMLRLSDAEALFDLSRDPCVTRYMVWDSPVEVAETEAFIRRALEEQLRENSTAMHFCIALNAGDRAIGVTSLTEIHPIHRRATTGSWIGKPFWGKGIMRETKALLLDFAFGPLGLERVQGWVDLDNQRSLSSLENCGFRREGIARRMVLHDGRFTNQVLLAILRGEHRDLVRKKLNREPAECTLAGSV